MGGRLGVERELTAPSRTVEEFHALQESVAACRRCPRLIEWCERVAVEKRAAYRDEEYWGGPVPSFGDPDPTVLVVGLAPGAHGANRTGRMFTGDRSGEWLYGALHRAGFASKPESEHRDDGLELDGLLVSAAVRCAPPANKPTPEERATCLSWLDAELELLTGVRVIVTLGSIAYVQTLRALAGRGIAIPKPRPRFGHAAEIALAGAPTVVMSYHPSQQNTFTGKLTVEMFDRVWSRARELAATPKPELP